MTYFEADEPKKTPKINRIPLIRPPAPSHTCQAVRQEVHIRWPHGSIFTSLSFSAQILHSWKVEPISQYSSYCSWRGEGGDGRVRKPHAPTDDTPRSQQRRPGGERRVNGVERSAKQSRSRTFRPTPTLVAAPAAPASPALAVSFSGSASALPVVPLQWQAAQSHKHSAHFCFRMNRFKKCNKGFASGCVCNFATTLTMCKGFILDQFYFDALILLMHFISVLFS